LPAGVLDGTVEAAAHLVSQPGVLVLVDGYNVTKLGWPALDLPHQRDALVNRLRALVAAGGAEIWVVFDGAGVEAPRAPGRPGDVQVRFSPPGVDADDEILALID